MKQDKIGQKKVTPLWEEEDVVMGSLGCPAPLTGSADPMKLIQDLEALRMDLEMQYQELLRSQCALMKSKICYTTLYDTTPVGDFTIDIFGTIQNANLTFADMMLMERASLLNNHIMDYIVLEDHEIFYRHLNDSDTTKIRQTCELRMRKKDGTVLGVQLETILISDRSQKPGQYRIVVFDISERKKAEHEKEKHQAKVCRDYKMNAIKTIAGGVAHNINNLLQIIVGNADLAVDELPRLNPAHNHLNQIRSTALVAAGIVKQLVDCNLRTGKKLRRVDIVPVIKESIKTLRLSVPDTIEFRAYFPDKAVTIFADPDQMNQILTHLFTNAVQAMEGTKGQLDIRVETKKFTPEDVDTFSDLPSGEYAQISVKDTGCGICPEIIDQIFDPYFTTRGFESGSGMGLAIVQNLVENFNGTISVDSRPERGTVFTLLFPFVSETQIADAEDR